MTTVGRVDFMLDTAGNAAPWCSVESRTVLGRTSSRQSDCLLDNPSRRRTTTSARCVVISGSPLAISWSTAPAGLPTLGSNENSMLASLDSSRNATGRPAGRLAVVLNGPLRTGGSLRLRPYILTLMTGIPAIASIMVLGLWSAIAPRNAARRSAGTTNSSWVGLG